MEFVIRRRLQMLFLAAAGTLILLSCSGREPEKPKFNRDMRNAYVAARELYGYVWSTNQFYEPASEKRILTLLDDLSQNFHKAELDAPVEAFEPGFRVTLLAQKSLLADAANRFKEGKKEYVNWKLRGMAANCISCHSRYQVPMNFVGDLPPIDEKTPESQFAQAEFLFATRQFDEAADSLFKTAESFSKVESGWPFEYRALKLWLVIEVRAKNRPEEAAKRLEAFLTTAAVPSFYRGTVQKWVGDLKALGTPRAPETDLLKAAETLLQPVRGETRLEEDELHFVTTLKATALLHEVLQGKPPIEVRRKGSFLLGLGYYHLPVSILSPFSQQYLEVTIRDFPHTAEALDAFKLYENLVTSDLGASGEGTLAPDQVKTLSELRRLAMPEEAPTVLMKNTAAM